ncbi:MAG TPA: GNAT family N-acetyltransferase [Gemmatimonadales bacterium]|nr:GNAT family N-acetyltransferase [Gemmatimonadales bacterium]
MAPAWQLSSTPPDRWHEIVASLGGGFFHSPSGLSAGAPRGEPVFALRLDQNQVSGAAIGVRTRCRLSLVARHGYFPSLPLLAGGADPAEGTESLVAALRSAGLLELIFDSFDAPWSAAPLTFGRPGKQRREYLVDTSPAPEQLKSSFGSTHRRHLNRGERAGWSFAMEDGPAAIQIMDQVQDSAAERAARRDDGFATGGAAALLPHLSTGPLGAEGVRVFVSREGDAVLSAALVGWYAGRAFYVLGGSTPAGYQASASVWLHWKIMLALKETGVRVYNFGGAPVDAAEPGNPAHGLHRFKTGFSPREELRAGVTCEFGTMHRLGHQLLARIRDRAAGSTSSGAA